MSQENVEIIRCCIQAWERGDEVGAMEVIAANVEVRLFPGEVFHGPGGVREAVATFVGAWDGLQVEYPEFVDAGDHVVVQVRWRGRGKSSGLETGAEFAAAYTLNQGKIVRYREFASMQQALEAVGLRK